MTQHKDDICVICKRENVKPIGFLIIFNHNF